MSVQEKVSVSRRGFLKNSALAIAAPTIIPSSVLGRNGTVAPSEKIVLGAIGIGPRGGYVLSAMLNELDIQCVAVCDAQASRRKAAKNMVDAKYGNKDCTAYRDMFELLGRKDIDAVLIATGDRWHAIASIIAAKAGKDVYSEKPCGTTMAQCQALADTMNRYGRVFQAGTQRRSISNFQIAAQLAQSGKLGKIHTLHASVYRPSVRYDWLPAEPEPSRNEVDWDRWLGPCPWRPYNKAYLSGGWHTHYDFEAGLMLLDWGAHTVDLCQMANGSDDTTPLEFTPHKDKITARYANGIEMVLDFLSDPFGDRSPHYRTHLGTCPVRYEGDRGWVETGDSGDIEVTESLKAELVGIKRSIVGTAPDSHVRNFFDCVKSRALTAANADVMRSSHIACYGAAIAWELGRKVTFDPITETFIDDDEANRLCSRAMRSPWHV
jgi:predicted dehydrogenase